MKFIILIIALILTTNCNAQNKEQQSNIDKQNEVQQSEISKQSKTGMDISFIDNEKIDYHIGLVACEDCFPIRSIGYSVIVTLTEKQNEIVHKLDKQTWLNLLNSPDSDFAANLILYSIYDKDAKILSMYNIYDKDANNLYEFWKTSLMKAEDLDYWTQHLK